MGFEHPQDIAAVFGIAVAILTIVGFGVRWVLPTAISKSPLAEKISDIANEQKEHCVKLRSLEEHRSNCDSERSEQRIINAGMSKSFNDLRLEVRTNHAEISTKLDTIIKNGGLKKHE